MKTRRRSVGLAVACAVAAAIALVAAATAQVGIPFNERDDQYTLLGLKRAKEAFELVRADLARQERLLAAGVVAASTLDGARRAFSEAEVNYQQSLLAALFERQYVAVTRAVKVQGDDGRKHVRLRLENASGGGAEAFHLAGIEDEVFRALKPDVVLDVYVALANGGGAIVGQPYEVKVEELRYGSPVELEFALLEDLEEVTVQLTYGRGSQRAPKIRLQKDAAVERVVVQAAQLAQEVDLGVTATFDLGLELFGEGAATYKLETAGLPPEIRRSFLDPTSGARLTHCLFTATERTRRAALQLSLPDRDVGGVVTDQAIPFWVLAVPRAKVDEIGPVEDREWSEEAARTLGIGAARLELVPRGVGRLGVEAPLLYFQADAGDEVSVELQVVNEGTRRLDNVEVAADPPLGWRESVDPAVVAALAVGEERTVTVRLAVPAGAAAGRYETRIRTTSYAESQPLEGAEKTVTVEVRPSVQVLPSVLLVLALFALVLGVVVFGVRLARR